MEYEEIIKKVQWLDDQERKSKTELSEIGARLASLDTSILGLSKHIKGVDQQVNDLSVMAARIEQFDQILAKHRTEVAKSIEVIEKNAARREQEANNAHLSSMEELRKTIFELRTALNIEQTGRKERAHEDKRQAMALQDLGTAVDTAVRSSK
jgi:chromosome segregation ATPase